MARKTKILIVEDNPLAHDTVEDTLSGLNCKFTWAESGEQALSFIKKTAFNVIIIDIKLPGIDGLYTFRRAKKLRPNLAPVIVLTGYGTTDLAFEAGKLEVFHF